MFVRNLLQAGDHLTVVPAGIRVVLQYSEKGSLEATYVGHGDDQILHNELLTPILSSGEVPTHLPIVKGTSYVYGCLYSNDVYKVEGKLTNAVESYCLSQYLQDPSKFHFFAGHIQSYAVGMNSPITIQRWLKTMNFNILPRFLIPTHLTEDTFANMVNTSSYPFKFPRIMSYILFRNGKYEFVSTNLYQVVVKNIQKYSSYDGYILADISGQDLGPLNVSYADVVNWNIHKNSILLINEDSEILDCSNDFASKTKVSRSITCEYCGKLIQVPEKSVRFTCQDEHCVSVMFNRVSRMLTALGLEPVSSEDLKKFAQTEDNIISLPDVLEMDAFKDVKINVRASQLLSAAVPSSIIPRSSDWVVFCNKCNNSVESILYYIRNSDKMMSDLNLDTAIYRKLYDWFQKPENVIDVVGLFESSHVCVESTGKRFDGAPIFRNKSIYITGEFQHGSSEDIKAILSSYSAEVYDQFNTAVDCVIIGGLHEGVSGKAIQKAKMMKIPIFEEAEFFEKYDIDADVASSTTN